MRAGASWGCRLVYIAIKIWKQLNQVSMVTIFLGLTMGSRYKEGNCSAVVLAKVTWYRLSCTVLVSRALNSKYSLFHILALSLSDTLESIGGLGEIKEGCQGCYLKKWFTQSQTYRPWASTFLQLLCSPRARPQLKQSARPTRPQTTDMN